MAEFEIKQSTDKQYYFRLQATGNSKTILSSERYTTKNACREGVDSVKNNAPYDSRYDRKQASNGEYYFNLKAANGQVIGTSEMYTTAANRDNGIELVKAQAPLASVTDLT